MSVLFGLLNSATPFNVLFSVFVILLTAYVAQQLYYLCDFLILRPYSIYRRLTAQGIPADPFIPIIGQAYRVYQYANSDRMVEMALDAEKMYGKLSVTTIGPFTILDCSDPEYISAAWKQDNDKYDKGPFTKGVLGPIIGEGGLILADEPIHTRNRKMIAVAFQHAQLSAMVNIMTQQTSNALNLVANNIAASSEGASELELHSFFGKLTFSIIMGCAFGANEDSGAFDAIHHVLNEVLIANQIRSLLLVHYIPILRDLPFCYKTVIDEGMSKMEREVQNIINLRKEGKSKSLCGGSDLLDTLLTARDEKTGAKFDDKHIQAESLTFVLAGHETSGALMTWVAYVLMRDPDLFAACRAEADSVCGGRAPTADELSSLVVIDAVLQEVLRLFPPVPAVTRAAVVEHTLAPPGRKPIVIPRGCNVTAEFIALHRNKEYWGDDADTFDHRRWLKNDPHYRPPTNANAFRPFSLGPRNCIGLNFALMEARAMVAMIVTTFDMKMVPNQTIVAHQTLTIHPKYGLKAIVSARKQ